MATHASHAHASHTSHPPGGTYLPPLSTNPCTYPFPQTHTYPYYPPLPSGIAGSSMHGSALP
eukprot:5844262-Pleurochrysis_carterae.AAC.1